MIPLSMTVSFVFLSLDLIGSRTEDPFENRVDDVPLTSLARTIECNLEAGVRREPVAAGDSARSWGTLLAATLVCRPADKF